MKTISHSGLRLVRNCLRQYKHAYVDLRRPRATADALAFGRVWDLALEAWHRGISAEDRMLRGSRHLAELRDPFLRAKAEAMLVGYSAQWAEEPIEIVATQVEFTAPIINPETGEAHPEYQFMGILDGVIRYRGRLLGLESKTSSEDIAPGSPYWQQVSVLDAQISQYLLGMSLMGYELESVLYDVAKKPALRPGKTETPEAYRERCALAIQGEPAKYFQRQEVVRLERDAHAYAQDLWDYACNLTIAETTGRWPRNPDRCRQYGRPCEYLPVCASEASIDDPVLYRTTERDHHDPSRSHPARPAA